MATKYTLAHYSSKKKKKAVSPLRTFIFKRDVPSLSKVNVNIIRS